MVFTVVMLLLSAAVGVGAWLYLRWDAGRQTGEAGRAPALPVQAKVKSRKVKESVKDLWEIEDVRRGVLLLSGNRYRLICRMSSADFWLLSEGEQNDVEDAAAAALMQITFPVQVLVTSQAVDTRAAVEELRQAAGRLPKALQEMALARAEYLEALTQEKTASARQAYLVIPYDTVKGFDHAYGELHARLANLADALAGAKVRVEPLSSEAVVDLLSHLLNRGRAWRPSEAVEAGVMSLYTISERSAVNA